MSYYQEKMRKILTHLTADWLVCHNWPRMMESCALLVALLAAYASAAYLLSINARNFGMSFAVGFICGYAVHEWCRGFWLLSWHPIDSRDLLSDGVEHDTMRVPGETNFDDWFNNQVSESFNQSVRQSKGLLGFVVMSGILGLSFVGLYVIYHAPWYFAKLLVEGGKVRHRVTSAGTQIGLFFLPACQSWPLALILLVHCATVGVAIQLLR
jgi:hypothetical protein